MTVNQPGQDRFSAHVDLLPQSGNREFLTLGQDMSYFPLFDKQTGRKGKARIHGDYSGIGQGICWHAGSPDNLEVLFFQKTVYQGVKLLIGVIMDRDCTRAFGRPCQAYFGAQC